MEIALIIIIGWIIGAVVSSVVLEIEMPHDSCYLYWLILWPVITALTFIEDFNLWRNRNL